MADEPLAIRGINWRQTFPFTHLFRGFRVAVHPSKMFLAMAMLILLYIGGCLLDVCWATRSRAVDNEIPAYEVYTAHATAGQTFSEYRDAVREQVETAYAGELVAEGVDKDLTTAKADAHAGVKLSDLKEKIVAKRNTATADAETKFDDTIRKLNGDAPITVDARRDAKELHDAMFRTAYAEASAKYHAASAIKNYGLFDVFFEYQSRQVNNVVRAVRSGNWSGEESLDPDSDLFKLHKASLEPGVFQSVLRFFIVGPRWLLTQHPLYFFLFGIYFLALWAVFGGAICRIAAVHVARDEKLSVRSALVFSVGKFLSFLCAPIIPLLIVGGIGLVVTIASLLGNIPWIGPAIIGITFILALVAGLLMAVVLLGLVGGFNLMYPTIAVEGSDSFDAISRSFSYLYARPWRLAFYTAVSVVYGAVTFLFIRLFIFVALTITHKFVSFGIFTTAPSTMPLLSAMWPSPETSARLSYDVDNMGLTAWQEIGAWFIWAWVHCLVAVLAAFVICFYFSASTIMYYLMREEVDATDLDDVYLDQYDDDFADPIPSESPVAGTSPAVNTPAAPGGSDDDVAPPT
jgi:hypothetical protein